MAQFYNTDRRLLDISNIESVQGYGTCVDGSVVWNTDWTDSKTPDGHFHRWIHWGPFMDLVELLENINIWDNKIAVVYNDGLILGFYDGVVRVGTSYVNHNDYIYEASEIQRRYQRRFGKLRFRPCSRMK